MNDEQQKNWAKRKSIPTAPEDIRKLGTGKILLYATANAIGQRINTILPKLSLLSAMASTIKMGKNSIAVWHVCVCVHLLRSHFHFYGTQEYIKPNCVIYFTIYFHSIGVCLSFHNHIYFGWLLFLALFLLCALFLSPWLSGSLAPWLYCNHNSLFDHPIQYIWKRFIDYFLSSASPFYYNKLCSFYCQNAQH